MNYQNRLVPKIDQSYFLFGPRGSGKSTWLKHAYPNATYLDLLDPVLFRDLSSRPSDLRKSSRMPLPNAPSSSMRFKRPRASRCDPSFHGRTGPWKAVYPHGVQRAQATSCGCEPLGGRLLWRQFHPYIASELGDSFDLRKAMRQGMLPSSMRQNRPKSHFEPMFRSISNKR
jgi:hypothetical protein